MHRKTLLDLRHDLDNKIITIEDLYASTLQDLKNVNAKTNAATNYHDCDFISESSSLLAGIPFACKDLVATKGLVTSNASAFLSNYKPVYNASIYDTLLKSDAKLIVKTNMDEFGMGGLNLNSVIGRTKNPYDTSRLTGGSSGGSAALVAAGCVPYAIGTDTGDSVRYPAALCGVYGFKPTWGRISRYGVFPYASSLDQVGIFSRSVKDIAVVLSELNGYDQRDSSTYVSQKQDFYTNLKASSPLKIAYIKQLDETFTNTDILKNYETTKEYLTSLNHSLEQVEIPIEHLKLINPTYLVISNVEATSNLADISGVVFGNRVDSDNVNDSIIKSRSLGLSKYTKVRMCVGAIAIKEANKDRYYYKAKQVRQLLIDTYDKIFSEYDLIIAPSTNEVAPLALSDAKDPLKLENLVASNHLALANLIGACSLSIPTQFIDGLPIGFNVMAKPFNDQLILDFALGFENNLQNNNFKDLQSFYNVYVKEVI